MLLQASGFDPETGQILDPGKFQKWKQQQVQSASIGKPVSNASLFDTFRKARSAIESWVDDDANRGCMLHTDVEEIKRTPEIQAILHEYAGYGEEMCAKLLRHLEFMVENRRNYHKAVDRRRAANS